MRTESGFESKWKRRSLWALLFFALVHGLVSFPNHHQFRTYALDLGLYTHALWQYAHGTLADCSLFLEVEQPLLADHFDLYLPLLSPLVYVTGSWTLLIVQWLAVLFGAWGVRRLALALGATEAAAFTGMLVMLLFFGVFGAMAFDYHSNVLVAMLLPWFMLMLRIGRSVMAVLMFVLMLMGKESVGLWLGPVAFILATDPALPSNRRWLSAALGVLGIAWSITVIGWLMPALSAGSSYAHFDYGILGASVSDVPSALITRPLDLVAALFTDASGAKDGTSIKLEFWLMLLAAGGWSLIPQWRYGLMALPLVAQKMWHDEPGKWSVIAHYGVELAPLVGIGVALAHRRLSTDVGKVVSWVAVILSLSSSIRFMDRTVAYHDRSRIRIYQAQHYVKGYDVPAVKHALAAIPLGASVSAQSPAVPHLVLRDRVYQYPIVRDADYLVFLPQEGAYPLSAESLHDSIQALRKDPSWELFIETDGSVLFRRADGLDAVNGR